MNQYWLETNAPDYFLITGWSAPNRCFYAAKVHQTWWSNPEVNTDIQTFAALEDALYFIRSQTDIPQDLSDYLQDDRALYSHGHYTKSLVTYRYQRDGALTIRSHGGVAYE